MKPRNQKNPRQILVALAMTLGASFSIAAEPAGFYQAELSFEIPPVPLGVHPFKPVELVIVDLMTRDYLTAQDAAQKLVGTRHEGVVLGITCSDKNSVTGLPAQRCQEHRTGLLIAGAVVRSEGNLLCSVGKPTQKVPPCNTAWLLPQGGAKASPPPTSQPKRPVSGSAR